MAKDLHKQLIHFELLPYEFMKSWQKLHGCSPSQAINQMLTRLIKITIEDNEDDSALQRNTK